MEGTQQDRGQPLTGGSSTPRRRERSRELLVEGTPQDCGQRDTLGPTCADRIGSRERVGDLGRQAPRLRNWNNESFPIDPRGPHGWRMARLNLAIGRGIHGPQHWQGLGPHPGLAGGVQVRSDGWIPAGPVVREVTSSRPGVFSTPRRRERSRELPGEGTPQGIADGVAVLDRHAQTGLVPGSKLGDQEGKHRDPELDEWVSPD